MKKLVIFVLLIIFPFTVNAATLNVNVKSLVAKAESKTIKYNGEMEEDSHAVMCKLYKGDDEVDYLSSAVDEHKFEGSFTVTSAGKYTVTCANYEGGDIKSTEVEVVEEKTPATSDKVLGYIALFLLSAIAVVGLVIYHKKNN